MALEERHELCVIGAGSAGFAAAEAAREDGRDVVVVTGADELGGTCILRGCMPAKAVLAASQYEGLRDNVRFWAGMTEAILNGPAPTGEMANAEAPT